MKILPAYTPNSKRAYCNQMKDLLAEATKKGLSRADIARVAGVDPSTVRNWGKTGDGSLQKARKLLEYLDSIEPTETTDRPPPKGRAAEIAAWIEEGHRLGFICPFALSSRGNVA